jgi:acylphosphatase
MATDKHKASDRAAVRIVAHGFVQGVNYRRWLQGEALSREISGWVRNRKDGTVEALLCGEMHAVDDLVRAARHGPALARVDRVHSEPAPWRELEGFSIADSE